MFSIFVIFRQIKPFFVHLCKLKTNNWINCTGNSVCVYARLCVFAWCMSGFSILEGGPQFYKNKCSVQLWDVSRVLFTLISCYYLLFFKWLLGVFIFMFTQRMTEQLKNKSGTKPRTLFWYCSPPITADCENKPHHTLRLRGLGFILKTSLSLQLRKSRIPHHSPK